MQPLKSSGAFQIRIAESNIPQALLQWISGEGLLEACSTALVKKNAMLKPTSYETKYFAFLKRVPSKNRSVMKRSALHITAFARESLRQKKKVLQAMEHLLLSLNPFLFIHLFYPSNFFIHPTCALCILPPPKEATERVKGRERRPRREASLAGLPYFQLDYSQL